MPNYDSISGSGPSRRPRPVNPAPVTTPPTVNPPQPQPAQQAPVSPPAPQSPPRRQPDPDPRPTAQLPPVDPGPTPAPTGARTQGPVDPPSNGSRFAAAMLGGASFLCCWTPVGLVCSVVAIIMTHTIKKGYQNANAEIPIDTKVWSYINWIGFALSLIGTIWAIFSWLAYSASPESAM